MLPHYIPAYSVAPFIGLVVNLLLFVSCLGLALRYRDFKPLRSLAFFYAAQSVFFLGYFNYGYQLSPESIKLWYGVMLIGLAWMPTTCAWMAADLSGNPPDRLFQGYLGLGILLCAAIVFNHNHPAILGLPLEPMPIAPVWRPQSWLIRPATQFFAMLGAFYIIYYLHRRGRGPGGQNPGYVRVMTLGILLMLASGVHDSFYTWGVTQGSGETLLWLGSICLSVCQAIAVAMRFRELRSALNRSEAKYQGILEGIEEGYYEVDLAGNLTFFNRALSQIIGYPPREMLGLNNRAFMTPRGAARVFETFNQVFNTGVPARALVWELVRKDGSQRVIEVSVSLLRDPEGEPVGFSGIARDITERKKAEEELVRRGQQLQQLASELTRVEDRQRRELAVDLHDGIGQYLAVMRLRLSKMLSQAEEERRPPLEYLMGLLEQAIADTRSLTAQLSPAVLYEVGLAPALDRLVEQARERYGLEIEFRADGAGGRDHLDQDLRSFIYRACSELLLNVAKHAQATRARVGLARAGDQVRLTVSDDGRGMDVAQGQEGRGKGLGLFSLGERAEFLGGGMTITSRSGQGTETSVWLPAQPVAQAKGE